MDILKHTIGTQEIYTTPGIEISLGDLKATSVEELTIVDELSDKLFKSPESFIVEDGELIDKEAQKE